ncbi:MAG: efflux RND transporter periplasmic adaptor subunit [Methylococcales bacterium]|nr:efflux RND transporter periplasmic adaptor subunit [Methylococcales bacterium]
MFSFFRSKKFLIIAVVMISLIAILSIGKLIFFGSSDADEKYIIATVFRGDIEEAISTSGEFEAKTQIEVCSSIVGRLNKVYVTEGESVKKGQLLAELENEEQKNSLSKSQITLTKNLIDFQIKKLDLKEAEQEFLRHQQLIKSGAVSQASLQKTKKDKLITNLNQLLQQKLIAQSRLDVQNQRIEVSKTLIKAPANGTVVDIATEEGEQIILEDKAYIILRLAELDTMTVTAQVSEADIIKIKKGDVAYFTILSMPEKRFYSTLRDIELFPTKKDGAIYYNVYFDIPNPNKIFRIGMTAQVSVVLKRQKNVLLIPSLALGEQEENGRYLVRVLDKNNKIKYRHVKIGINDHINAQVLEGLGLNEKVIIGFSEELSGQDSKQKKKIMFSHSRK